MRFTHVFRIYAQVVVLLATVSMLVAAPVNSDNDGKDMKRKKAESILNARLREGELPLNPQLAAAGAAVDAMSGPLAEMWAREAKAARNEVERLLQVKVFSFAPMPSPSADGDGAGELIPPSIPPRTAAPVPENCLNGRTPEQYLLDVLLEISNVNVILDPNSHQGQAFNFILGDPAVREDVCEYPTIEQRYALGT